LALADLADDYDLVVLCRHLAAERSFASFGVVVPRLA
jgi:hypothetical protein